MKTPPFVAPVWFLRCIVRWADSWEGYIGLGVHGPHVAAVTFKIVHSADVDCQEKAIFCTSLENNVRSRRAASRGKRNGDEMSPLAVHRRG